jgi:hypothetical protein
MKTPEEIHAECLVKLKQFIEQAEAGEIRIAEMSHTIGIKPWSGEYSVSTRPIYSGKEWIDISDYR